MTKVKNLPLEEKLKIPVRSLPLSSDTKIVMSGYKNLGGILKNYSGISCAEGALGYNVREIWYLLSTLLFNADNFDTQRGYYKYLHRGTKNKIDAYVNEEV